VNHNVNSNKMVSDTPRTDDAYFKTGATMYDLAGEMKRMERELNAANAKIERLIEERDRANRLADWKWNLRGEFESLLGTDNIEDGIKAVKEMLYQIKLLEEASNIRLSLITKLEVEIDELNHRIKRMEEAGDNFIDSACAIRDWDGEDLFGLRNFWIKAKEDKL
jgi:hypothetical protein